MFPLTLDLVQSFYGFSTQFRTQKRSVWLMLIIFAVLANVLGGLVRLQSAPAIMPVVVPKSTPVMAANPVVSPLAAVPASPAKAVRAVGLLQNCTPATYNLPAPINLTNKPSGLSQIVDITKFYQVFGNTSTQIKVQLRQCAPAVATDNAGFAAATGGNLTWQYDTTVNGSGTCSVSNVKVGLHLNMILPQWQATDSAASGLTSGWSNLISALTLHENGHTAIYHQYAQRLLEDLQAFPATDCGSLAANVAAKAAGDVAALDAANATYDATTNHGVNQGAVLR